MDAQASRTIVLGVILAILVVPLGGPAAPYGIAIVAALVLFDLWRQQVKRKGKTDPVQPGAGFCPRCGSARQSGGQFCQKCGLELAPI